MAVILTQQISLLVVFFIAVLSPCYASINPTDADHEDHLAPVVLPEATNTSADFGNETDVNATADISIVLSQPVIVMFMDQVKTLTVNYSIRCNSTDQDYDVIVSSSDHSVLTLASEATVSLNCSDAIFDSDVEPGLAIGSFDIDLKSDLLGRSWLIFTFLRQSSDKPQDPGVDTSDDVKVKPLATETNVEASDDVIVIKKLVLVLREYRMIDFAFRIVVYIVVIVSTIGMGMKTDIKVIREVMKKPSAPIIGFLCQYVGMPLIAFTVAKTVKFDNPAVAFGIFAAGVSPGGGVSNVYTYLLNGDVSLSVTMTTISTIAALGMLPLWMFTLGRMFEDDKMKIVIPYIDIVITLSLVILPVLVGFLLQYKLPKVTKILMKVIKPFSLVTIIVLIVLGLYTNQYIFRLFKPTTALGGCLLPYFGYILGGLVAFICRQPWARVKTISIETGIQNVGVAFFMLMTALPPPDSDLAAIGPVASAVMTPLPIFVVTIIYVSYNKWCKKAKYDGVATTDDNKNEKEKITLAMDIDVESGKPPTNGDAKSTKLELNGHTKSEDPETERLTAV